jgi:hypothetical protein
LIVEAAAPIGLYCCMLSYSFMQYAQLLFTKLSIDHIDENCLVIPRCILPYITAEKGCVNKFNALPVPPTECRHLNRLEGWPGTSSTWEVHSQAVHTGGQDTCQIDHATRKLFTTGQKVLYLTFTPHLLLYRITIDRYTCPWHLGPVPVKHAARKSEQVRPPVPSDHQLAGPDQVSWVIYIRPVEANRSPRLCHRYKYTEYMEKETSAMSVLEGSPRNLIATTHVCSD